MLGREGCTSGDGRPRLVQGARIAFDDPSEAWRFGCGASLSVGPHGDYRAFDVKDGHQLWNFDVVPKRGEGSNTWPTDPSKVPAGGGMYSSYEIMKTESGPAAIIIYSLARRESSARVD
jgi:hypothetical protein